MWYCKNCNEENEYGFSACWNCGYSREGIPPENPQELKKNRNRVKVEQKRGWQLTTWLVILAIVNFMLAGLYLTSKVYLNKLGHELSDGSRIFSNGSRIYQMSPVSDWFFLLL